MSVGVILKEFSEQYLCTCLSHASDESTDVTDVPTSVAAKQVLPPEPNSIYRSEHLRNPSNNAVSVADICGIMEASHPSSPVS
jgi:hypothetical protein